MVSPDAQRRAGAGASAYPFARWSVGGGSSRLRRKGIADTGQGSRVWAAAFRLRMLLLHMARPQGLPYRVRALQVSEIDEDFIFLQKIGICPEMDVVLTN